MENKLRKIVPNCNIKFIDLARGPVDSVTNVFDLILEDEEVIVSYCDFGTHWDCNKFLKTMRDNHADGGVPCYIGFHPHMLGKDNYAFVNHDNMKLIEIREKQPFTNNKMNEYASNGIYYFRTGKILKHYFKKLIDLNIIVNNEYYVSCVYNLLVKDDMNVLIYEIENMLQWGTPYDLESYKMWSNYFRDCVNNKVPKQYNMTTILPMAGKGSRFSMVGYELPKPLLLINNKPMVINAIECLPKPKETIFVGLKEHFEKYEIQEQLNNVENQKTILIDETTNGQATTCMIAIKENNIDDDESILISACDNGVYYNIEKYDELMKNDNNDIILWTFDNNPTSLLYPQMYAWVDVNNDDNVVEISNKKQFVNKRNKNCIIGTMFFRKSKYFTEGYNYIIKNDVKTNNEFYVDDMLNYLIKVGYTVKNFTVDYYLCWGTPNDYKTFLYWQNFFDNCWWHLYKKKPQNKNIIMIAHRINKLSELNNVPEFYGVEIDLRDSNGEILVTHDPFTDGIKFEEYLKNYKNKFIILNIKSEGIEIRVKELLNKYNVSKYFFLDSSFPMICKLIKNHNEKKIAIRLSEYEDIQSLLNIIDYIDWVWVDYIDSVFDEKKYPLNKEKYHRIKNKVKLCLVSPELHDIKRIPNINIFKKYFEENEIKFDMICTKLQNVKLW
jgi:NDP-sugar pyrophosphorylase family protein